MSKLKTIKEILKETLLKPTQNSTIEIDTKKNEKKDKKKEK